MTPEDAGDYYIPVRGIEEKIGADKEIAMLAVLYARAGAATPATTILYRAPSPGVAAADLLVRKVPTY